MNKKYAPLKLHWKVPFGKYSDLTIKELIDIDESYFKWLMTTDVKFTEEVMDYYECEDKSKFDEEQNIKAIKTTISKSSWQTIKIKPEDRNFDLKPEDFDEDFGEMGFEETEKNKESSLLTFDLTFLD